MRLDGVLFRSSGLFFAAFAVAVLLAFWPSYFSRLANQPDIRFHLHGTALTLWCVLLVSQALLIRSKYPALHRSLGKLSFVLVPAIVVATVNLIHFRLQGVVGPPPAAVMYFIALILNALVAFAILYCLAIYYRGTPAIHARYMVATVFPLFTPVTDRLIGQYWPGLAAYMPNIGGATVLPVAGFILADTILLGLWVWDWRARGRPSAFAVALGVLVTYHWSVLYLHAFTGWQVFCAWFLSLPLS